MATTAPDDLVELITYDMRQAMKNKQRVELDELRSLLARISNAEAISQDGLSADSLTSPVAGAVKGVGSTEAQRRVLSAADIKSIIFAEQQEIESTLSRIDSNTEYAADLRAKIAVVQKYL
jgi:uncharacterized protein YqeY